MRKFYSVSLIVVFSLVFSFSGAQVTHIVTVDNFMFTPSNFSATIGDVVHFQWVGGFHTSSSRAIPAGAMAWDEAITVNVQSYDYTITVPGTYNFACNPHEFVGMTGTFTVSGVTPVKMTDLKTSSFNDVVRLQWKTLNEENADHFSIQQSVNGIDFEEVGTIPAAGFSNAELSYSYSITNIPDNRRFSYFRVVTIDRDHKPQYSSILLYRNLKVSTRSASKIFPNPARNGDHLRINFESDKSEKVSIVIFDGMGKNISSIPFSASEGFNQTHIMLPKMSRGQYFLRLNRDGKQEVFPLMIR